MADKRYGCMMLSLVIPKWEDIISIIDENDVWNNPDPTGFPKGGKEKEPHTTLLYGFHEEVDPEEVYNKIFDILDGPIYMKSTGIGCFENDKNDVVKFDIESPILTSINSVLKESFPFTSKFPDYHPHITIAYTNSGTTKKYVKEIEQEFILTKIKLLWSNSDGKKEWIVNLSENEMPGRLPSLDEYLKND